MIKYLEDQAYVYACWEKHRSDLEAWQDKEAEDVVNAEVHPFSLEIPHYLNVTWRKSMKTYLKIKIKSLAAESKIIRHEEKKWPGEHDLRRGLYQHRVGPVRYETRYALLAYGFLRHRSYKSIEQKCHQKPDWQKVERLALKYGEGDNREIKQRFAEWIS